MISRDDEEEEKELLAETSENYPSSNYEEAIAACGTGPWHWLLLLVCGWSISSDAVEVLSLSFILAPAQCDLQMSSFDKGLLNSSIFVGMMLGGYLWGSLSDVRGRRAVLMWSLSLNGFAALASSFAQQYWLFLLLRIISGLGVGGSMPTIFSYFVEFLPAQNRGAWISAVATFWMNGNLLAAALAWIIIPNTSLGFYVGSTLIPSWRVFLITCTFPALSSALIYIIMPESPKILLKRGQVAEAERVLSKIYRMNRKTSPPPSFNLQVSPFSRAEPRLPVFRRASIACMKVLSSSRQLFSGRLLKNTVILIIVYFTISFGYYGLWMWLPQLFARIQQHGGSVCKPLTSNATASAPTCAPGNQVYIDSFITATSNLPGNLLSILLMDRVGRRYMLAVGMSISGLSVFFISLIKNHAQNVAMSAVFGGISAIGFNALDCVVPELFPTNLRGTAQGTMSIFSRTAAILANLIFGLLVDVHCIVPLVLVAALMVFGGLSALRLPETTNIDIS